MSKNSVREEYKKQRRRIQSFLSRAKKRGYQFLNNVLPRQPKKITKASIRRLAKLTPDVLYEKATWVDPNSGESLRGVIARQEERKAAARRAAKTRKSNLAKEKSPIRNIDDTILSNFRSQIRRLDQEAANYFQGWKKGAKYMQVMADHRKKVTGTIFAALDGAIAKEGKANVVDRLEENAAELNRLLEIALLDYKDKGDLALSTILEIVGGTTLTLAESLQANEMSEEWGMGYEGEYY